MVRHNSLTNNLLTQQAWNYTQTLQADMDAAHTFKASGFTMNGNHTSSFQNTCLSNGKTFLQSLPQPSLDVTTGGKSVSDSTVTILPLSIHGKAYLPSIPESCLCCAHFLTAAKNNFTVSLKHLPGEANEIADALSRKQFTHFFRLAPQAQQLPTPTPGTVREL